MTASNIRALAIGGLAVVGVLVGATVWQRRHPDAPLTAPIAKLTEPPSLTAPKAIPERAAPDTSAPPVPHPAAADKPPPASEVPNPSSGAGVVKGPPPQPEPAFGHGEPPHFDTVRVEPSGDAVIAGKGDANARIVLRVSGSPLTETKSDPTGAFVLIPPTLKPGNYDMSLRQSSDGKPTVDSRQTIALSIPTPPSVDVVVALAEPGRPTKILAGPPEGRPAGKPTPAVANAPPPPSKPAEVALAKPEKPETAVAPPAAIKPPGPDLAIRSVELENGTGFFASGTAAAGTRIQIYLNDAHLAEVVAGRDHQWSVTVKRGLAAGHYIVRADASGEGRTVTARVEVPFDVPVAMAAKPEAAPKPAEVAEAPEEMPKDLGKPNEPPPEVAARIPHEAPVAKESKPAEVAQAPVETPKDLGKPNAPPPEATASLPNDAAAPKPAQVAETPEEMPKDLGKPNAPPPEVAARIPHEAPAAKVETPPAVQDAGKSSPSVIARSAPPEPPAVVPTPRPDVAAAAKARVAAAPSVAPPVLAAAPPTPPEQRPTPPPAETAVSPPRPAQAPPTLAAAPPTVAPPKVAVVTESKVPSPPPPATQAPDPANAVIEQIETVQVVRGDNLWNISRDRLGVGYRYTRIYQANNDQIRDPKLIYPGQVFVIPAKEVAK